MKTFVDQTPFVVLLSSFGLRIKDVLVSIVLELISS